MTRASASVVAILTVLTAAAPAKSDAGDEDEDDAPADAPTSTSLDAEALEARPRLWPNHLLQYMPGLAVLGQSWNAPQYLLRGFDTGSGETLGVSVDGLPVNEDSHSFAHGYADLGFVIPETIARVTLHEGGYAARFSSSAVAGQLALETIDRVAEPVVRITTALDADQVTRPVNFRKPRYRLVGLFSPDVERGSALLATEVALDDGPFVHKQQLRRAVLLGKWKRPLVDGYFGASVMVYSGRWFDSGLLSSTAIEQGRLTPLSSADPTQGGIALRTSTQLDYEVRDRRGATWHLTGYVVDANHRLYVNPTLFVHDPLRGDELEFVDERVYYGVDGFYRRRSRLGPIRSILRVGMQARADHASTETWHNGRRLRLADCFEAANPCTGLALQARVVGLYVEDEVTIGRWLRVLGGARFEQHAWNVDDRDPETMLGPTTRGGTGARARISPKLGVVLAGTVAELWLRGGAGVLDTDARAAVDFSGFKTYVRTYSGEVGARFRPATGTSIAVSAFASWVGDHLAWNASTAESIRVGAATRTGLEARFAARLLPWLTYDAAISIARGDAEGTSTTPATPLALAPRAIGQTGLAVRRAALLGALRVRTLGPRLTSDPGVDTSGHTIVDAVAGYRWRMFDVGLTVENLLDTEWRELQLASDVRTSRHVDARRDLLVTPGIPRTVWLTLGYAH